MKKLILLYAIVLIHFHGCYPVSHIVIGEKKNPINVNLVKVYSDFPEEYEKSLLKAKYVFPVFVGPRIAVRLSLL